MYFKGVELTSQKNIKYCTEYHCNKSIPLCCICISPDCCENPSKWFHISSGEHICSVCYSRIQLYFSYEKECKEIYEWKQTWLKHSYEHPISTDFILDKLMPMWCVCTVCKKWRQVNRDFKLTPSEINNFQCGDLIPHSKTPCQAPEDNRIELIKNKPKTLFESIKYQPLLGTVPCLEMFEEFPLDVVGICPTAVDIDFAIEKCPDFMGKFNPFAKRSKFEMAAGSIDPSCMEIWEHEMFPMFSNNLRNIFIGLRNVIMVLWAADPRRVVDEAIVNQCVLMQGIVRVALLMHTVPDMLRVYTALGYINYGFVGSPLAILERSLKKDVIVINSNLSGLVAANHLDRLGAKVTVLELHELTANNSPWPLKMLDSSKEVHGSVNNPLCVAAYQLGISMTEVPCDFTIFNYDGTMIKPEVDSYFQSFVYGFVDYLLEEVNKTNNCERYQFGSVQELYEKYRSKEFDPKYVDNVCVQEVYLAEIEYRMFGGACLDRVGKEFSLNVTTRRCSNFDLKYYLGGICEPSDSWNILKERLASEVTVSANSKVLAVTRTVGEGGGSGDKFVVTMASGDTYESDLLLLSVDRWQLAGLSVAADIVEGLEAGSAEDDQAMVGGRLFVVRMLFRQGKGFWRGAGGQKLGAFAIVPRKSDERGFCHLFTETEDGLDNIVLQAAIFGAAARTCHSLTDGDIVARALRKLACLSPHLTGATPRPYGYEVQRHELALGPTTDLAARLSQVKVTDQCLNRVYINEIAVMHSPRSLSAAYAAGLDTATRLVRDLL